MSISDKNYGALLSQGLNSDEDLDMSFPEVAGFEIIRKLGDGGMGEVYLAYDTELGRNVALKIFQKDSLDPLSLERIRQESQMMARVQHPNVLRIYHVKLSGDPDSPASLVLEFADGGDLARKIRSEGKLSLSETVTICLQICDGLSKIHALGIIHRDIKPANILLTKSGTVKVADLGIAKDTAAAALTMTGTYMGSMLYVAPEQMSGNSAKIDGRADIWSMGILIYEMLVGITPKAVLESELMEPLPESIRPVVRKCLVQNPDNRFQNIEELKQALIGSQEPVRIPQPPNKASTRVPIIVTSFFVVVLLAAIIYISSDEKTIKPETNQPEILTDSDIAVDKTAVKPVSEITIETSLIAQLSEPLQPDRGNWSLTTDGKLTCARTPDASCISLPVADLGIEYDLSFNFERTEGTNSLAVYLPTSCGPLTFELDAWNEELAGIQSLNGQDLRQHEQKFQFKITNEQLYQVSIKVREDHVEVEVDGKVVYHCDISDKRGSIVPLWEMPRKHALSIGAWNSAMTFSDIVLKKIP